MSSFESVAASLDVGEDSVTPGFNLARLPITLLSAGGESVAALQFDVTFDSAQLSVVQVWPGEAATVAGKTVSANEISAGNYRIIVSGFNLDAIPDGTIASVCFSAPASAAPGQQPVDMADAVLSDPLGVSVPVTISGGRVEISAAHVPTGFSSVWNQFGVCVLMASLAVAYLRRERLA